MESELENAEILVTNSHSEKKIFLWKPFLRQLAIAVVIWTMYFVAGLMTGGPTVILPQLRRELNTNTTKFNEDYAPWISSIFGIGGIPWVFILSVLLERIGRKFTCLTVCLVTLIGYIVFYTSDSALQLLLSEVILGILVPATGSVMPVIMTEYTSPRYRGIFLTFKSASFLWGIWVANAIGTFVHWKNIGILAFVCCSYTITIPKWPESPHWLASKGRFEECAAAHRWLKGIDFESEQELTKLIESQRRDMNFIAKDEFLTKLKTMVVQQEFYKPTLIGMLIMFLYFVSGKMVCSMYIIEIMKRITENEAAAYKTMLILDGVTVAGAYVGSFSSKSLKRRTLLMSTTSVAILFLFTLSLYLYLIKLSVLSENDLVSISLLTIYSIAISSGVLILNSAIVSEIIPLKFKSWCVVILSLFIANIHFAFLRIAPVIFRAFGLHGTFLFYAIGSSVTLFLVYIFIPETKDKTLQEIENYFKSPTKLAEESAELFMNHLSVQNSDERSNK